MEKLEKIHPVLAGIIMDAALDAVDALLTNVSLINVLQFTYCVP